MFAFLQRSLQSLLLVTVEKVHEQKSYRLGDLLELRNKLMLMSSKGEHGKEQVNRFTQVRDIPSSQVASQQH